MSLFLEYWDSAEITELQALHFLRLEEEDGEGEERSDKSEAPEEEGDRELTGEEILAVLDGNLPKQQRPHARRNSHRSG